MPSKTDDGLVAISKDRYEQLVKDSEFLSCLEDAGVDSWYGYSYAYELLEDN